MRRLPSGWRRCTIAELGEVRGGRQRSPHHIGGEERPYLRVANVMDGWIDTNDVFRMRFTEREYREFKLQAGDILLNEGQSLELVGRSAVYRGDPPDCCFQNTLIRFRSSRDTNPEFARALFEHLMSKGRFAAVAARTTSIAHLGTSRFAAIRVACPTDRSEQLAIGRTLAQWDVVTEQLDQLLAAKRRFKRGLMQTLLTGQRRFKHSAVATDNMRKVVGSIPADWPVRTLGDLFHYVVRRNETGVTLVLTASGEHGLVDQRSYFDRKIASKDLRNYYLLRRGEFAYNRSLMKGYPYGAIKRLESFEEGVLSSLYLCFALRDATSNGDFFAQLFESGALNSQLRSIVGVGARAHGLLNVAKKEFFDLRVPIPPRPEQDRIAAVLTACDREIELLGRLYRELDRQRAAVAELLLTGKARVPEALS